MAFPFIHWLRYEGKKLEEGNVYTYTFAPIGKFNWRAGQHAIFRLPCGRWSIREQLRAFSISSAPSEGVVRFTTRYLGDKASAFKQTLHTLSPGTRVLCVGPLMDFYLKPKKTLHVGITGGIGITPLRSMLTELDRDGNFPPFTLFYQNAALPIIFKEELDAIATRNTHLTIRYLMDPDQMNVGRIKNAVQDIPHAQFYVSGAPGYIRFVIAILKEAGVTDRQITQDGFWDPRERIDHLFHYFSRG